MSKFGDLIEAIAAQDGNYVESIGGFVSVYPSSDDTIEVEIEYSDADNDHEIVSVERFTLKVVGK